MQRHGRASRSHFGRICPGNRQQFIFIATAVTLFTAGVLIAVSRLHEGQGSRRNHQDRGGRPAWRLISRRQHTYQQGLQDPTAANVTASPPDDRLAQAQYCDLHFGEAWLWAWNATAKNLCSSATDLDQPTSKLTCRSMVDGHMTAASAPHVLCSAQNLALDPSKLLTASCPKHRPGYLCSSPTYHRYAPGAFGLRCDWPGRNLSAFPKDHLQDIVDTVTADSSRPQVGETEETPALLVTREISEHANVFHMLTDMLNVYITLRMLGWGEGERQVLLLDNHPPSPFDPLWAAVAGGGSLSAMPHPWNATGGAGQRHLRRISELEGVTLLKTAAFVPPGYTSLLFAHLYERNSCPQPTPLFSGFREWMLTPLGLSPKPSRKGQTLQASLISRRPVKDSRGRTRKIVRRIGNEDALLAALQGAASGVDVRLVELAELDLLGQLKLITETDILIGMHGAGLAWSLLMPEGGALLELWPADGMWRCYEHTAEWAGLLYRRWVKSGKEQASTTVNVTAVADIFADIVTSVRASRQALL